MIWQIKINRNRKISVTNFEMQKSSNPPGKFENIEFLRFLFCIIIVYFHIFHSSILKFIEGLNSTPIYKTLCTNCSDAWIIVEFFFIMAGFFLYKSYLKNKNQTFVEFAIKKIIRLWPVFAFATFITIFLIFKSVL